MARRPNVIVFFTDQQRWDTLGVHNNPLGLTPNLDRMARMNTDVHHCFTCQPVCGPARASLQTGLYATQAGCPTNSFPLAPGTRTLAHCFREAGYDTGYIGKWHLGTHDPVPEEERGGYGEWLAANLLEFASDAYQTVLYDNDNVEHRLPGYRVDAVTDAAIRYVDAHQAQPFYLFVSYIEPHFQNTRDDYPAPYVYTQSYGGRWMPPDLLALGGSSAQHWGGYCGMVKRLDEAYGRLMDALTSLSLLDDTVVLYTSDHGCHFKTRNSEYKRSGHESSIRVPGVLAGGPFQGGGRIDGPVSLLDFPPTLLDAAGIPVPSGMAGHSLLPQVADKRAPWQEEVYVQISETQVARAVRTRRWKYIVSAPGKDPERDFTSDVYVEEALYDLYADPYELNNLVGYTSHRRVADVLQQRLLRRMAEAGEPPATILSAPEVEGGQKLLREAEELL